jgi:hypothetical protein
VPSQRTAFVRINRAYDELGHEAAERMLAEHLARQAGETAA